MKLRITPSLLSCRRCTGLPTGALCPVPCDRNIVLSGWSSSLKHSRDSGMITAGDYAAFMHIQIAKICARPECRVLIAAKGDDLVGFIAGEPTERVVYYCFVKELHRREGIAKALFAELGIDPKSRFAYPAETGMLVKYDGPRLGRKIPLAVRDPAVARYPKKERHRRYA